MIIKKYGFLTYPEFLDNFYVRHRTRGYKLFIKLLNKYYNIVQFAVLPDFHYPLMRLLIKNYPDVVWIFPLHHKYEIKIAEELGVEWIGMPHRDMFKDYDLAWFLRETKNYKRWYLGFWAERTPEVLLHFDGMDTTIPETYAGKFGKIWLTWGKAIKPPCPMKTIKIFETNVLNLRIAINELMKKGVSTER